MAAVPLFRHLSDVTVEVGRYLIATSEVDVKVVVVELKVQVGPMFQPHSQLQHWKRKR